MVWWNALAGGGKRIRKNTKLGRKVKGKIKIKEMHAMHAYILEKRKVYFLGVGKDKELFITDEIK